jgi:hypothetical protein
MKSVVYKTSIALLFGGIVGCSAPTQMMGKAEPNNLTTGQVQITLKKGETTQTEVIETFGSPNLVTYSSDGDEVWTYQKHATVASASSSSAYATVILLGASTRSAELQQASRTMTLIIKFKEINGVKRVSEFQSRSSSF